MSPRCYTVAQILEALTMGRSTFYRLKEAGELPCLEELKPRLGRRPRYRADLFDRWLANQHLERQAPRRVMAKATLRPLGKPDIAEAV